MNNVITFSREKAGEIQRQLGKRPDKKYEADYLRRSGFAGNYQFWDELEEKWVPVRRGMRFELTPTGPRILA